jgi:hypothetical protein
MRLSVSRPARRRRPTSISHSLSYRDTPMTEKELLFAILAGLAALMFVTGFVLVLS